MNTLTLPWPDRRLSPNARAFRLEKAEAAKEAKEIAFTLARNAEFVIPAGVLHLRLVFFPPDRKRRDLDNLFASCKAFIDGAFAAGGTDDFEIQRVTLTILRNAITPGGEVFLEVFQLEEGER